MSVGDYVLVRNLLGKGGPGKLRSYWEQEIYVIVDRTNDDQPDYDVKKLNGSGKGEYIEMYYCCVTVYLSLRIVRNVESSIRSEGGNQEGNFS